MTEQKLLRWSVIMTYKINEDEWNTLFELPTLAREIYHLIRYHMDFKSGISGIKRKLNLAAFVDYLTCAPKTSRKPEKFTRSEIRNGIQILKKEGLIEQKGPFVFVCLLADRDKSKQNEHDRNTTRDSANNTAKKNNVSDLNKKEKQIGTQPGTQPTTLVKHDRYPVSGNNINNLYTSNCEFEGENEKPVVVDNSFDQFWKAWPNKKGKSIAQRIWKNKKLVKHISEILADIAERKKLGYFVDKEFVPHGSTYLNQERWKDEDKGPQRLPTAKQVKAANDDEMATAEEAYLAVKMNGGSASSPYSFPAEVISCISGFRNLSDSEAHEAFVKVYNQRKPMWIARRQETQNTRG